jgi:hypothetical protein
VCGGDQGGGGVEEDSATGGFDCTRRAFRLQRGQAAVRESCEALLDKPDGLRRDLAMQQAVNTPKVPAGDSPPLSEALARQTVSTLLPNFFSCERRACGRRLPGTPAA